MSFYRWTPGKAARKDFAEKMTEIDNFCTENNISQSKASDSYYFTINGQQYRVSNHTVNQSNRKAYNFYGEQIREKYHPEGETEDTIYITASKTRIIEIFNNLKTGKKLDRRGNIIVPKAE